MYKPFNINNPVKFKLTKEGYEILKKYDKELESYGNEFINLKPKRILDNDGCYEMPLWKLMYIFGEGCKMSKNPPFKNCKIFIKEKDIFEK
ncbi:MAG: hypothetical protein WBG30_07685 [Psychrilyobacter sp.]|uniref:hypothetical protein n=1 Tax=Psychrilyobacter sp. TaxID=2586924 RepID=UPI003C7135FC